MGQLADRIDRVSAMKNYTKFLLKQRKYVITQFVVQILIFTVFWSSCFVYISSENAKDAFLDKVGNVITLSSDSGAKIQDNVINQIIEIEHVIGINQNISDYAVPVNFENSKEYSGINPSTQTGTMSDMMGSDTYMGSNSIVLDGNINTGFAKVFRLDQGKISAGIHPSELNSGALISEQIAETNGLSIGDHLSISFNGNIHDIAVIGIYNTTQYFEITKDNYVGKDVFAYSPYNRIYVDMNTAITVFGQDTDSYEIFVDEYQNIDSVGKELKNKLELDWGHYTLTNTTETIYQGNGGNIIYIQDYSHSIISYLAVASVIICRTKPLPRW